MRRLLIAALAAPLLAGCGGDGGGSGSAQAPAATPVRTATATPSATPAATASAPAPGSKAAPVAATLRRFAAAMRAGDARTVCRELLAREVLARVEAAGGSCEANLIEPRVAEGGPDYAIAVRSIRVRGDRAVAEITATERDGPRDSSQPLVRERGGWRLAVR